jgi:hypothetical protein
MDAHGVPVQVQHGGGVSISDNGSGPDKGSSSFQAAQEACRKYLPGGGPQALTPAQQAANRTKLLALAQCMRKHGFPNFPDPNSQGAFQFTGGSTGNFSPDNPQFRTAIQSCGPGKGVPIRIAVQAPGGHAGGGGQATAGG